MRLGLIRMKYDQAGGAERTLALLARGLLERGHEVLAVTSHWEGKPPAGLRVELVDLGRKRGAAREREFARAARERMSAWGPDCFLALDKTPGSPLYRAGDGCHAAWLDRRVPYEPAWKRASFRLNPRHRAKLDLERRVFASPELKKVIANSRMAAEEVSRYYGLAPEKITVIYNGVDEDRLDRARPPQVRERMRAELGLDSAQPVLLFLGSGFERKGLAFALAALRSLPDVVLLAAGRDRTARYEKTARRLGLGQRVRFLGQRSDAPELIAACDAMLLPTIYDPCANACLEALHLGRPVVTTLANGAAELLQDGLSGQAVADPADEAALALACERALGMPRGFAPAAPSREQWLDQTVRLMEEAAS